MMRSWTFYNSKQTILQKTYTNFFKGLFATLDSTSISTYSKTLFHAKYGYNKDRDTTKQLNSLT